MKNTTEYYGEGVGGVNKIFGYYVVFEWSLSSSRYFNKYLLNNFIGGVKVWGKETKIHYHGVLQYFKN